MYHSVQDVDLRGDRASDRARGHMGSLCTYCLICYEPKIALKIKDRFLKKGYQSLFSFFSSWHLNQESMLFFNTIYDDC